MSSIFDSRCEMSNVVFLDTEFTDFTFPELLSIGMVSKHGDEHYVELDLCSVESERAVAGSTNFVVEHVLTQWDAVPGAASTLQVMGSSTADYLETLVAEHGRAITIVHDYPLDYQMLKTRLVECGRWDALSESLIPFEVSDALSRLDGALAAEYAYARLRHRGIERHHALADAHALRAAYFAILTGKRVSV